MMKPEKYHVQRNAARDPALSVFRARPHSAFRALLLALVFACFGSTRLRAQDAGPLTPPPVEHDVHRVTNSQPMESAPPSLPPAEIIKGFTEKEEKYLRARTQYGYKKTIKLTEFGADGQPSGELVLTTVAEAGSDGRVREKYVEKPTSSLRSVDLSPDDLAALAKIPAYPVTASNLAKYLLKFIGDEKVDEIDCYIFEVKPKLLERSTALFQGVIWVDKQYLEVVKTYGKWVTDLGDARSQELPFVNYETYRENVDGKYWIPNYTRSDADFHRKEETVPMRLIIKWTEFKPLAPPAATPAAPVATPSAAPPASNGVPPASSPQPGTTGKL
jgi:hypothetical protein